MTPATEPIALHRVIVFPPRGALRICRGICRCGWQVLGPYRHVERRSIAHERGRL